MINPSQLRASISYPSLAAVAAIVLGVCAIYLPSLRNPLVFDDALLTSGGLFETYGALRGKLPRELSYGSFVWVQSLLGEGWAIQRVINVLIHLSTALLLYFFHLELSRNFVSGEPAAPTGTQLSDRGRSNGALLGILLFCLNPVAVYAVAYLVQRSILMATLFSVASLLFLSSGLRLRRPGRYVLSFVMFVCAMISKEYAISVPLVALTLYLVIRRPARAQLVKGSVLMFGLVAGAALFLIQRDSTIIGKPFDDFSKLFIQQLAQINPEVGQRAFLLSIINQTYLFFKYLGLWFLPYPGWMSIDLRPPFPVRLWALPHLIGVFAYLGYIAGSIFLVVRYRDERGLLGLLLLIPALLFTTEFITVWVQDPFVLYRSYLWAITFPGIVAVLMHGSSGRSVALVGAVLGVLFTAIAFERVISLGSKERLWTDAITKQVDDPRAVGRWFAYVNRAENYIDQGRMEEAFRDFAASARLGDRGIGAYNVGAMLASSGRFTEARAALATAEAAGYTGAYELHLQKGIVAVGLREMEIAHRELDAAAQRAATPEARAMAYLHAARGQSSAKKPADAIALYDAVLAAVPDHPDALIESASLALQTGAFADAERRFSLVIAKGDHAPALLGRAIANHKLNKRSDALRDIREAKRLAPTHPGVAEWLKTIEAADR